ncbi:MAG: hypothetical protein KGO02_21005 [Alphaproteobacteria bacterium]|nr:hypothetical protein [Alphaproteobacteria bacterium]
MSRGIREQLPNRRRHEIVEFEHGGICYTAGIGRFADGRVAEIFVNGGKPGCQAENAARDAGILASIALQRGATAADLQHSLPRLNNGCAAGPVGHVLDLLSGNSQEQ